MRYNFKDKKIIIMGLGLQGRGLGDAKFFAQAGAKVLVTDLKTKKQLKKSIDALRGYKIKYVLGKHRIEDFINTDIVIKGPDIPLNSSYIKAAREKGVAVEMDDSLFAKMCPCPIIGITGTRGKTTTTHLIAEILKLTDKKVYIGGNILGMATLPLIKKVKKNDLVVLELSSWQLQGWGEAKISPHISVITNIYPDHLTYYGGSMKKYVADKKQIYKNQTKDDYLIINKDNPYSKEFAREAKSKIIWFSNKDLPKNWKLNIVGEHNKENVAAAIKVAEIFQIPKARVKKVVENFKGVEHRLQFIKAIDGIKFYNDTTSTAPIALEKALCAFDKKVILIAGGKSKSLPLKDAAKAICKKAKETILLEGSGTDLLIKELKKQKHGKFYTTDNLKKAVDLAYSLAQKGDIILFSPGFSSFEMFENEFDRGRQFVKLANKII